MRRGLVITVSVAAILAATPGVALAHGIGGRLDLPVPLELFIIGAASVLVLSFAALTILWTRPRLQDGPRYHGSAREVPGGGLLSLLGVVALLLVVAQLIPPLLGLDNDPRRPTVAPVTVWVLFWLVVPFGAALIGNWYTYLNPWRALARILRLGRGERLGLLESVGVWPAAVVFLAFTWLELVSPDSGDPHTLGVAALVYTFFMLAAADYAGRDTGFAVFDAFTGYNRVISAISPLGRSPEGRLVWRGWLRSLPVVPEWPGLWAFVVVMIGTVSYDGASGASWFRDLTGGLLASMGGQTFLLVGSVVVIGVGYWAASAIAARYGDGEWSAVAVMQRFAHTLVPIALAYAVAHYFTLIIFEGQQMIAAVSDPLGLGWDLFGTADRRIDFFITQSEPIWYFQVASIVVGHVLGVVLAHDRALQDFGKDASRSQYAMLVLMIALTSLGLLILAG